MPPVPDQHGTERARVTLQARGGREDDRAMPTVTSCSPLGRRFEPQDRVLAQRFGLDPAAWQAACAGAASDGRRTTSIHQLAY